MLIAGGINDADVVTNGPFVPANVIASLTAMTDAIIASRAVPNPLNPAAPGSSWSAWIRQATGKMAAIARNLASRNG